MLKRLTNQSDNIPAGQASMLRNPRILHGRHNQPTMCVSFHWSFKFYTIMYTLNESVKSVQFDAHD
jgi:hypothetical protein